MSNIDKREIHNQQLKAFITGFLSDPAHDNQSSRSLTAEVFRIALASLEAEAVGEVVLGEYDDCGCHPEARVVCIAADGQADWENFKDGTRLYSAPPAPVSVPDLKPVGFLFVAEDGAVAYSPTDWPMEGFNLIGQIYGDLNASRAAMLQGADRPQNEPQNIPENIPATQFKPVADLYGLTSPTGGETSFTFDAVEARDFIDGGWSCQEYVELGRFQEAVSGNSPVIPGCSCLTCRPLTFSDSRFVVCPECGNKRCPHANDHRNACTGSNEPGQEGSAYPAAPQQEVESQIRKGKTVAMEEWELGARLTKHRFKP
ncbi:hypothetical protein ACR4TH_000633 [Enterobacter hormaechei]|uniref:hypothetical protein n=1 Tax=Enterobacter hormaechei TaxID=158836 RepID=UPI00020CF346|nr:hypothetical protein [Enterobacter hormaechei]EGK62283.1 eaa protein [Enterobacter hormaechei ATCC 49162]MCL8171589.1 hypothetical protein [Enterobacter hormaechei]MCM7350564.1 hypothetical protein [Enterobacter hormaechei]OIR53540.1 hypothetical protein BH712_08210 [Enterobacter hormaechei ATCC 49162]UQQ44840.1 hypothetical protein MUY31_13395 [Enterobacter hormaechei]